MMPSEFHYIGITGGVGSGKSFILRLLKEDYGATVLSTDRLAEELEAPGTPLNKALVRHFKGTGVFDAEGNMDRPKMASLIFREPARRQEIEKLVHPAVLREIDKRVRIAREEGKTRFFFVESALLLEYGFDRICDELWYIRSPEKARRERLKKTRGYTDEKIDSILKSQRPEEDFLKKCSLVIDNGGTKEEAKKALGQVMDRYRGEHSPASGGEDRV